MNAPAVAPGGQEVALSPASVDRRFALLAAAIVVVALLLRVFYVLDAKVDYPISGDVNQYVLYASNLNHAGTFSSDLPNGNPLVPDSYRGPGYPFMIAAVMRVSGHDELGLLRLNNGRMQLVAQHPAWMFNVCLLQALLGALTVLLTIVVARFWLSHAASLGVGALTAFWPHLISFAGVMLSETLFGFVLMLSVWLLLRAWRKADVVSTACAGLAFAATYLVNPIVGLFPLLACGVLLLAGRKRLAVVLLAAFLAAPVGWSLRNASLPSASGSYQRAAQNFVQGSWPDYLTAYNDRFSSPIAHAVVQSEADEEQAFLASPSKGLRLMSARMADAPATYAGWYFARKPWLLWDWSIRIGWGDIYFLPTPVSPFTRVPVLGWMKTAMAALNPVVFGLALLASFVLAWRLLCRRDVDASGQGWIALLLLYLTAVHTVLQAEPRYSVPYRPEELLMAATAVAWLVRRILARAEAAKQAASTAPSS